jgi:hypothetical protein
VCNTSLGYVQDRTSWLKGLIAYLEAGKK